MIFSVKERQMEHLVNDLLHCRLQAWTFPAGIEARSRSQTSPTIGGRAWGGLTAGSPVRT